MKKLIILALVLSFITTGCFNYKELDTLSIVSGISIEYDVNTKDYELGFQIYNLENTNEGGLSSDSFDGSSILYKGKGKTIAEAVRNVMNITPKKLYLGGLNLILISEEFADSNLDKAIDFLMRDLEINKNASIVLVKNSSAYEALGVMLKKDISSDTISSLLNLSSSYKGNVIKETYEEFISDILEEGKEAVIPVIEIVKNKENEEDDENNSEVEIEISGLAYFEGNRLKGYMNLEESFAYDLIMGKVKKSVFSFSCSEDEYASIEITEVKSGYEIDLKKNISNIKIKVNAYLSEVNCDMNLKDKVGIEKLENLAKSEMNNIIWKSLNKIEEQYKIDLFGYERYLYRNEYKYFIKNKENIKEIVSNINSRVEIDINIIRKGGSFNWEDIKNDK